MVQLSMPSASVNLPSDPAPVSLAGCPQSDDGFVDDPSLSAIERVSRAMTAWGTSQTAFAEAADAHQSALLLWLHSVHEPWRPLWLL